MRRFGLSAAVVAVFSVSASGAYPAYPPLPAVPDGPPAPLGYPAPGYEPSGYTPAGFAERPDYLPPIPMARPMSPMDLPPVPNAAPPGPVPNSNGFAFDPYYASQRPARARVAQEAWVRADWLNWSFRDAPVPPLIVTGNPGLPSAGIPGGGNVLPLVGPTRDLGRFNGIRATVGQWWDPEGELGGELSAFVFGRRGSTAQFTGGPGLPLSVPVLGTDGTVGVYDFSFPNRFSGALALSTSTFLMGAEANLLHRFCGDGCWSVDGIFGYRYLQLNESLDMYGRAQSIGAAGSFLGSPLPAGSTVLTTDSFRARTDFHGAQIGARFEARRSMFTVTAFGKGGAGVNLQVLNVGGSTQVGDRFAASGVRALPGKFGRDTNTDFSMIGEAGLEVGLQVTKNLSVRAGYNMLWWSDVLRPGTVISPVTTLASVPIDPTYNPNVPGVRPTTTFHSSDFLAHGLVVGLLLEW
jgi:hypothetical protein